MMQIYFLSIVFNALTGYMLVFEDEKKNPDTPGFSLRDEKYRLILGILTVAAGVLKLLSAVNGDVRILGDLFPAAAGMVSGFILVLEYLKNNSTVVHDEPGKTNINLVLFRNRKIIGIAAIAAAILHFLFPTVLFL